MLQDDDQILELAFRSTDGTDNSVGPYLPAKDIEGDIAANQFSEVLPTLQVEELYVRVCCI